MTAEEMPPPMLPEDKTREVAEDVHVMPDQRVEFVPNVGIIVGDHTTLVIDTGTGPRNGDRVLAEARRLGGQRPMLLTTTHFHPEHGFGAQSFVGEASLFYNRTQLEEFRDKRHEYLEMFSGFGKGLATLLSEVEFVDPHLTFDGRVDIDLGGIEAVVRTAPAHTRGDQIVWLPRQRVVFTGDLVLNRMFPILPDPDADAPAWLRMLDALRALGAEVVVPGHGEVAGPELIDQMTTYLELVQRRVGELVGEGRDREALVAELTSEFAALHDDWDNHDWIHSAIESFHDHAMA